MGMSGFQSPNRANLVVGEVYGKRVFYIDALGRLNSYSANYTWKPGLLHAQCDGPFRNNGHDVAANDCECGFWAYFGNTKDRNMLGGSYAVKGIIAGSGRVTMGSKGFRSEKAKIVALVQPRRRWFRHLMWNLTMRFGFFQLWAFFQAALWIPTLLGERVGWGTLTGAQDHIVLGASFAFLSFIGVFLCFADSVEFFGERYQNRAREAFENVSRIYPDVKIYKSMAEAEKDFPLSHAIDSAPADPTSEEFWTAKASW